MTDLKATKTALTCDELAKPSFGVIPRAQKPRKPDAHGNGQPFYFPEVPRVESYPLQQQVKKTCPVSVVQQQEQQPQM